MTNPEDIKSDLELNLERESLLEQQEEGRNEMLSLEHRTSTEFEDEQALDNQDLEDEDIAQGWDREYIEQDEVEFDTDIYGAESESYELTDHE